MDTTLASGTLAYSEEVHLTNVIVYTRATQGLSTDLPMAKIAATRSSCVSSHCAHKQVCRSPIYHETQRELEYIRYSLGLRGHRTFAAIAMHGRAHRRWYRDALSEVLQCTSISHNMEHTTACPPRYARQSTRVVSKNLHPENAWCHQRANIRQITSCDTNVKEADNYIIRAHNGSIHSNIITSRANPETFSQTFSP
jgi:hypothetical protein